MPKADVGDRICLNHPDRPASARCAHCQKPVCAECLLLVNGAGFCSDGCAKARAQFAQREAQRAAEGKRRERFGWSEWGVRAALLLLSGGILYYVLVVWEVRSAGDLAEMLRRMF